MGSKKRIQDPWAAAATAAIISLAESRKAFTSDDVWRLIGGTPEPRRLGARLQEAERNQIIRKGGLDRSTRASRHKAPIRIWLSNKNEPQFKDRETQKQDLQIALEALLGAITSNGLQITADWLDTYGGLHRLDSGYKNTRLLKLTIADGFTAGIGHETLQTGIRRLVYEADLFGYPVKLSRCGEYGSEEITTFDSSSRIIVSDRPVGLPDSQPPSGNSVDSSRNTDNSRRSS